MLTATPHCVVCYDDREILHSISAMQRGKVKVLRRGRSVFLGSQGTARRKRELAELHVATPWKEKRRLCWKKQRSVPLDTWCQPTKDLNEVSLLRKGKLHRNALQR
ncbi:hypothetical protein NDU88_010234 [Pleurodeles waltl]|uniref:Uncharacterized protein n=1 Tax=Pleurodeles waltl TaxID=8319 RepID=A0AAV7QWS9_PLEWA|nr:hypothetical protein NDU88_010234 [Pleurodeles waltl]